MPQFSKQDKGFRSAGRQPAEIARFRIDNLPVHLGDNGTSNGSRFNLQLLKSYKDVAGKLALRNVQISLCQNT